MTSFLKKHPFAVTAHFRRSLVLTFCAPKEALIHLVPECFSLDTFEDRYAFVAVAMVEAQALRPAGFPRFWGSNFFLIGYRIFVRFTTATGKRLRGLYILRSETDRRQMEMLGNLFTHYRYVMTDITSHEEGEIFSVSSVHSNFDVTANEQTGAMLPAGSPFRSWKEARRYAGPLPFTFSFLPASGAVLIVEGVRGHWEPLPVTVLHYRIPWLNTVSPQLQLCSAFMLKDIPYRWKKGRIEKWRPQ